MSIENIKEKILAESKEYSEQILSEAETEKEEILSKAKEKANQIKIEAEKKAEEEATLIKSRRLSVASLEARKYRLKEKQDQINKCFQLALDKLAHMDEDKYIDLLVNTIINIGGEGGEIILNERDKNRLGEKLIETVNDRGKMGRVSLADDVISGKGGFILRRGSIEVNSTLETMVNAIKEDTTPQVVEMLYGS